MKNGDDRNRATLVVRRDRCRDKLLLDIWIFSRQETNPAAEKHDLSEATFLFDGMGYLTALARCDLRGHLDYVERILILALHPGANLTLLLLSELENFLESC